MGGCCTLCITFGAYFCDRSIRCWTSGVIANLKYARAQTSTAKIAIACLVAIVIVLTFSLVVIKLLAGCLDCLPAAESSVISDCGALAGDFLLPL
jgi:hypothetical protein